MGSPRNLSDIQQALLGATEQLQKALGENSQKAITDAIQQWTKTKNMMVQSIMAASLPDDKKMSTEDRQKLINLYQNVAEGVDNKVISPLLEKNLQLRTEMKEQQALKGKAQEAMADHLSEAQEKIRTFRK